MEILRTEDLSIGYPGQTVASHITFQLSAGEVCAVTGPNGAGKTTLLKTLIRSLPPVEGNIFLEDRPLEAYGSEELGRSLAVVLTEPLRAERMDCGEVVLSGRLPYTGPLGLYSGRDRAAAEEALKLTGAWDLRERPFQRLSDGQRQRVLLARAVCQDPRLMVLDEPASFLDLRYQLELLSLIRELSKKRGIAVILSLHDLPLVRAFAHTALCLRQGRVDRSGPPAEILTPEYIETLYGMEPGGGGPWFQSFGGVSGGASFFQNRGCPAFPCHKGIPEAAFNCLFCYCPLYTLGERCGGNFSYTPSGVKNCAACAFPHQRDHYQAVLDRFPELSALARRQED